MMDGESLSEIFAHSAFDQTNLAGGSATSSPAAADDDIFSVLKAWEAVSDLNPMTPLEETMSSTKLVSQKSNSSSTIAAALQESENELNVETSPKCKRHKLNVPTTTTMASAADQEHANNNNNQDGLLRMTHITVERNRRKQMNDHLSVLRSLMPCFYVKRGDQASIIGGVVNYINELQQVLQSLEAKKQRKVYSEVLSPRILSSPRSSQPRPRKPPLSPRLSLPISPRTPQQPSSPYKLPPGRPSPCCSSSTTAASSNINDSVKELVARSKSAIAEVEVKFAGPNVLLKTVAPRIPGQVVKIVSALEDLSLQILQLDISNVDDTTAINSFTIKIGIECQLSAEELAHHIQQTFC